MIPWKDLPTPTYEHDTNGKYLPIRYQSASSIMHAPLTESSYDGVGQHVLAVLIDRG